MQTPKFKNRSHHLAGFTLIEMLVVLAIVLTLLLLLMPPIFSSAMRAAYNASCSSNLNQLYIAHQQNAQEHILGTGKPNPRLGSTGEEWIEELQPYLKDQEVFLCPEDQSASVGQSFPQLKLGVVRKVGNSDSKRSKAQLSDVVGTLDLHPTSLNVRMLSQTQADRVWPHGMDTISGTNRLGPKLKWDSYEGQYVPDSDPTHYWLFVESDYFGAGGVGSMQYQDFLVEVTHRPDGSILINPMHLNNSNPDAGFVLDTSGADVLSPPGPLLTNDSRTYIHEGAALTSYGINPAEVYTTPRQTGDRPSIVLMDYLAPVVQIETWHSEDGSNGYPSFARHPTGRVNVVRHGGSIGSFNPYDISPVFMSNDDLYWGFDR